MPLTPIYIEQYYIYDIFHNDNNKLIIISPSETEPANIKYKNEYFILNKCSFNHTYIYVLENKTAYKEHIEININGNIVKTKVNKYPEFKNEIIMSTMVYNEDNYIRQWIKFYLNIGIDRFIIYDNSDFNDNKSYKSVEKTSNLKKVLNDYIEAKKVILIKWCYPKRLSKSGISGQTTQQNHSIYAFQHCKYIGLFDVDEYINMQKHTNIKRFLSKLIKKESINVNKIGGFRILCKLFYNINNLPENDYNFFKIYHCSNILDPGGGVGRGREKHFVIPKNLNTYSIHTVTSGKPVYTINTNFIYFNHYFFLNKPFRARDINDQIVHDVNKRNINMINNNITNLIDRRSKREKNENNKNGRKKEKIKKINIKIKKLKKELILLNKNSSYFDKTILRHIKNFTCS